MKKYFTIIIIFFFNLIYSQNTKVTVLNNLNRNPIIGVQILSEEGSLLLSTNEKGEFNLNNLRQNGIRTIIIYEPDYKFVQFNINEVPKIIYLDKKEFITLDEVIIKSKKKSKYYKIRGYARSWKLVNNKLVKYGDALVEWLIPYKKSKNSIITGIKKQIIGYRTFKIDSIKQKSRIISFSGYDNFFDINIPKRDILIRQNYENYTFKKIKDSLYSIVKNNKNIGYVIYNNENIPIKINLNDYSNTEVMKTFFGKFSVGSKDIENWIGNGNERHLLYSFSNLKKIINTKLGSKTVETINEIFINNEIIYSIKQGEKIKKNIDKDRSYYNTEYWEKEIKTHPLPKKIKYQLIKINENKNTY